MDELRQETTTTEFRSKLKSIIGTVCANCGSEESIEYHHIVPIKFGGTNNITNFAPLCHKCHEAAHHGRHISKYVNKKNSGRKKKATKEQAYEVYDAFANGEIGTKKCKELLGYKAHGSVKAMAFFEEYLKERGIKNIRNNVDIVGSNSPDSLIDGRTVGSIEYLDGSVNTIFFKDTGLNDVKYIPRNLDNQKRRRISCTQ